jgi:hypothetical protein
LPLSLTLFTLAPKLFFTKTLSKIECQPPKTQKIPTTPTTPTTYPKKLDRTLVTVNLLQLKV